MLPVRCPAPGCKAVLSPELLNSSPCKGVGYGETREVECPRCYNVFDHIPKKTRGDPQNLAYDGMHIMKKNWDKEGKPHNHVDDMTQ